MQEKINHLKYVIGERKELFDRVGYGKIVIGADLDTTIRVGEVKSHVANSIEIMQKKLVYYKALNTMEEKLAIVAKLSEAGFVPKEILEKHTREIDEFRKTYPRKQKEVTPVSVETKSEVILKEVIEKTVFCPPGEIVEENIPVIAEKKKRGRPSKPRVETTLEVKEIKTEQTEPITQVKVEEKPVEQEIVVDNISKRDLAVIAAMIHANGNRDLVKPLADEIGFDLVTNEAAKILMSNGGAPKRMSGFDIKKERFDSFDKITAFIKKPSSQDEIVKLIQEDEYKNSAADMLMNMHDIYYNDESRESYSLLESILFDGIETSVVINSKTLEVQDCFESLKHEDQIREEIKAINAKKPKKTVEIPRINFEPVSIVKEEISEPYDEIEVRNSEPELVKPLETDKVVKTEKRGRNFEKEMTDLLIEMKKSGDYKDPVTPAHLTRLINWLSHSVIDNTIETYDIPGINRKEWKNSVTKPRLDILQVAVIKLLAENPNMPPREKKKITKFAKQYYEENVR